MKLGTLLLRNAAITLSQLETALRTQVLYGGRLGTNLVELGFIDVNTLTEYLAESLEVPVAKQDMFEAISQQSIDFFGADLARRYEAFPLHDPDLPAAVQAVAMVNPKADHQVAQLATELGKRVVPHISPELRIYYYLEKHYGITRKARYVRVGSRGEQKRDERRRTQPAGGIAMPAKVTFSPQGKAGNIVKRAKQAALRGDNAIQIDADKTRMMIRKSRHRDAIADVITKYAAGRFGVLALFLLRDNNALGWRLHHENPSYKDYDIEALGLPLGPTSVLQAAHDSGKTYRGGPLSAGKPTERQLWNALGVESEPREMLVVPVQVKLRVVNLIYAHGLGAGSLDSALVTELEELAEVAGASYTKLITAAKTAAKH